MARRVIAASPGLDVLDVGTGTGIAAGQFQAAGCAVLGVDPDVRMAEIARRRGVSVEVAKFEDWDAAGRTFAAVIAATAWHWVDPVSGAVKAAHVLRPGGVLAVFGRAFELPPKLRRVLAAVLAQVAPDPSVLFSADPPKSVVQAYEAMYATAADAMREVDQFGDPEQWRIDWERSYRRDEWLDQVPTLGIVTRIAGDKLPEVLDRMGAAIDAMCGSFTLPYATIGATAIKRSPRS
ncbi:MAG: class I SAM-dependent methyltransferase [Solirubrobacteraceae bacterium]